MKDTTPGVVNGEAMESPPLELSAQSTFPRKDFSKPKWFLPPHYTIHEVKGVGVNGRHWRCLIFTLAVTQDRVEIFLALLATKRWPLRFAVTQLARGGSHDGLVACYCYDPQKSCHEQFRKLFYKLFR